MARERWDKKSAFIMAAIGSAIGLGNVWRFPYMAYSNGGGAFFIPYLIALITTGIPLLTLEYFLGIHFQKGPSEAFGFIKKRTNFIGWFSLAIAGMITFYYTVIMGWSWIYILKSFGVEWAGKEKTFLFNSVLNISSDVSILGGIQWPILLGNLLTWIAIFLIIFRGIKIVGKIVNWTVGLPWLMLLFLIIRGITLQGAANGLNYYLHPNFSKLLEPQVWLGAYGQIFFSLSLGFGIMIAYSSYLPKRSDINSNAWIVAFSNCATSFFAGFAVFSTLGFLAYSNSVPVDEVVGKGITLAFITFPTAIAKLPGGVFSQSLFGIMFFLMLLTLGIDSAFSLVEAIVTGLKDTFQIKRKNAALGVCIVGFIVGTIYTTNAGLYWLDIVDHWMNWGLIIVGLLEMILIGYFTNIDEVIRTIDGQSNIKLGKYWVYMIKYFSPIILIVVLLSNLISEFNEPYEGYPLWARMIGGWILLIGLFVISLFIGRKRKEQKIIKLEE